MKKFAMLFVAVVLVVASYGAFAQNVAAKTFPLGTPFTARVVMCDDKDSAIAAADSFADGDGGMVFSLLAAFGICSGGETVIT